MSLSEAVEALASQPASLQARAMVASELTKLEVEVHGVVDHRGVMMVPGAERIGVESVECVVHFAVAEGTPAEKVAKLQMAAEGCCAVSDNLRNATPVNTTYVAV